MSLLYKYLKPYQDYRFLNTLNITKNMIKIRNFISKKEGSSKLRPHGEFLIVIPSHNLDTLIYRSTYKKIHKINLPRNDSDLHITEHIYEGTPLTKKLRIKADKLHKKWEDRLQRKDLSPGVPRYASKKETVICFSRIFSKLLLLTFALLLFYYLKNQGNLKGVNPADLCLQDYALNVFDPNNNGIHSSKFLKYGIQILSSVLIDIPLFIFQIFW